MPEKVQEEPGRVLRRIRERLHLKYRDVQEATEKIALRHGSNEFAIGLSRLADIENRGTIPSIFRLYSLCAVYGIELKTMLSWFGIEVNQLAVDALKTAGSKTRVFDIGASESFVEDVPEISCNLDVRRTSFLSRSIQKWGRLPLSLLPALEVRAHRYALIGTEDWSMYPVLRPGSFVQIDESRRKPSNEAWAHELERPIYLVETREGFRCGWCTQQGGSLVLQYHPVAQTPAEVYSFPTEAEVVGQVAGVAMHLDQVRRRHTRF